MVSADATAIACAIFLGPVIAGMAIAAELREIAQAIHRWCDIIKEHSKS